MTNGYLRASYARWMPRSLSLLAPLLLLAVKGKARSISPNPLPKGIYRNAGGGMIYGSRVFQY